MSESTGVSDSAVMARRGTPANLKPFKPGQSGNPHGSPKWLRDLRKALSKDAEKARQVLSRAMDEGDLDQQIAAARIVLKYTVPEPKQTLDLTVTAKPMPQVSVELLERVAEMDS